MVLDTLFVELSAILTEIHKKNGFFRNVGTNMHTKMPWTHAVTSRVVLSQSLTMKTWV